jgi:hypothetical protein
VGGVLAGIASADRVRIVARVPAAAETGPIVVSTAEGAVSSTQPFVARFVYDSVDLVEGLAEGRSVSYLRTLFLGEALVRGDHEFYLADRLGSVIAITDPSGAMVTRYRYDPEAAPCRRAPHQGIRSSTRAPARWGRSVPVRRPTLHALDRALPQRGARGDQPR